jgi:hypothetical protein
MSNKFKPGEIHKTISKLLEERLKYLITEERSLNLTACIEIYTTIFNTLVELITEAGIPITNDGMNFLAQQYYDGVRINGNQELDPNVFTQRIKLENIETKELALLAIILSGTDFAIPILAEIKKRS